MLRSRRIAIVLECLVLVLCVRGSAGAEPSARNEKKEVLRGRIRSIWGAPPRRPANASIPFCPRLDLARKKRVWWERTPDGRLVVGGTDPEAVRTIQDMNRRPLLYLPEIEQIINEALGARRLWELDRMHVLLSVVMDGPRARAAVARLYLNVTRLVRVLPSELSLEENPDPWAKKIGLEGWEGDFSDDRKQRVWKHLLGLESGLLNDLTIWRWRGNAVREAAIRALKELPAEDAGVGHWEIEERLTFYIRINMALRYLELSYLGDDETKVAVEEACRDPQSALTRLGGCGDAVAHALLLLSR